MSNRPTLKTIAELTGLSQMAVSKALRDAEDISGTTKEKVKKVADELGYTPNVAARNLCSRRCTTIGMVVPEMGADTAYDIIFNEISAAAAKLDYCVMLGSSQRSIQMEEQHCRMMIANQAGALIVASCTDKTTHIKAVCGSTPVIFIGGKSDPEEDYVLLCDYRHSGAMAVEYLAGLGHRDIVLLTYDPENRTIRQKEEGFCTAMKARGLAPRVLRVGHASNTMQAGMDAVEILLRQDNFPTALWCASDPMALGAIRALKSNKLSVPKDVSVMGHDDLYPDQDIRLTTFHTPMRQMGQETVKLALALMEHDSQVQPRHIYQPELVVRDTTRQIS